MNKRKILILLVLAIAVIGFSMGPVSAKSMTVKKNHIKYMEKNQYIDFYQEGSKFYIYQAYKYGPSSEYKITKAKVYFKYKGKTKVKTYKANKWGNIYKKSVPKGYKLIKAKVYYKKVYNFID